MLKDKFDSSRIFPPTLYAIQFYNKNKEVIIDLEHYDFYCRFDGQFKYKRMPDSAFGDIYSSDKLFIDLLKHHTGIKTFNTCEIGIIRK